MNDLYKISAYTSRIVVNTRIFYYNTFSDNLLILHPTIDKIIQDNKLYIHRVQNVHPDLFAELLDKGFIIKEYIAEYKEVENQWIAEDNDDSKFTLIVNPTLSCNMRCWYCYETHLPSSTMPLHIYERLKNFSLKKIQAPKLKGFNLDFFGGEPLLVYKQCTKRIIDFVYDECKRFKKHFYLSFTTNAYLLNEDILADFDKWADFLPVKLQITLDGNSICHDNTRKLGGKLPTYEKILGNISKALEHDVQILLRLNYTNDNIFSFYDVIDDLGFTSKYHKKKLVISFHRVWQNEDSLQLRAEAKKVASAFKEAGFEVENTFVASKNRCYGDHNNTIVINYDGAVYKCTARDFNKNNSEGILTDNGEVLWNKRHNKRLESNNKFRICRNCKIYPICHAGCSQNRLEKPDNNECPNGLSERAKEQIIQEIIESKLENHFRHE